ncbi:Hypothetical protein A7982_09956 [Minicystis rosea]|nr:Hypothetical protein A7982_09956 [Minicystis rosea]
MSARAATAGERTQPRACCTKAEALSSTAWLVSRFACWGPLTCVRGCWRFPF